jgi:hypothetical protein
MKTLSELKKVAIGTQLKLIYRFGKEMDDLREVGHVQSNSLCFRMGDKAKGSWLEFPPAARLEFTDKGFKIYGIGKRELTDKEKSVLDNVPRDPKQEEIDAYSDGNTMFYRERAYLKEKNMMHLTVYNKGRHLVYEENNHPMIKDPLIKGELELEYNWI